MSVHVWKINMYLINDVKNYVFGLEKWTLVSIDKIIENKNSLRMWSIFCFTLSKFFVQKDQSLVKKSNKIWIEILNWYKTTICQSSQISWNFDRLYYVYQKTWLKKNIITTKKIHRKNTHRRIGIFHAFTSLIIRVYA